MINPKEKHDDLKGQKIIFLCQRFLNLSSGELYVRSQEVNG